MRKKFENRPIRVLIVEDSWSQRELLVAIIEQDARLTVAGTANDGRAAIEATLRLRPDVIAMDIHLPILDGYAATRAIMHQCPTAIVLISSSTGDAQRRSVEALAAGALAVVSKPGSPRHNDYLQERDKLLTTLRLMAEVPVVTRYPSRVAPAPAIVAYPEPAAADSAAEALPQVLALAASTGGPAALQTVLQGLGPAFPLPIVIVQHIARGFGVALAEWLNSSVALPVRIAVQDEHLLPGRVYLAPDHQHLLIRSRGFIALRQGVEADRYCPSADLLFESVARAYGSRAIGVILTGMGDDGARGLQQLRKAGGWTLAQDAASCVVNGMPQAAIAAGAIAQVAPLTALAGAIARRLEPGAEQTTAR